MEEASCIVCLSELPTAPPSDSSDSGNLATQPNHHAGLPATSSKCSNLPSSNPIEDQDEAIARVLPCEHNFHQSCLRPWVTRANSCPICRGIFNQVELRSYLDGPCVYSYAVQDKQQVAEVDGSLIIEDDLFEEPADSACILCDGNGGTGAFIQCEGCSGNYHISCVGLRTRRRESWYCQYCQEEGFGLQNHSSSRRGRSRPAWMEAPDREAVSRREWNRVWQSVHQRTNIDLDFPFNDENEPLSERTNAERREFREWSRRFQIAESQSGVGPANAILQAREGRNGRSRRGTPHETGESQEEIRAWNAFDKARQILDHPESANTTNKRKSRPASPQESGQEARPTRALKKPRTRRVQSTNDQSPEANAEPSSSAAPALPLTNGASRPSEIGGAAPSFLQSLLKEVESGPPASDLSGTHRLSQAGLNQASDPSSPGSPGFGGSLASSNHSSPRGRSPSPASHHSSRTSSPPPLASRIEPNYAGHAKSRLSYSPVSPVQVTPQSQDSNANRATSPTDHGSSSNSPSGNGNRPRFASSPRAGSPSRQNLSVSAKEEVQKLVRGVLESQWTKQFINRDQFTEVNRDVSRKLYEMVGNGDDLTQPEKRQMWVDVAAKEVRNALQVLKPSIKVPDDGK